MPVKAGFFNHKIMTPAVEYTPQDHNEHYDIDDDSREYMKPMEACNSKKEICKIGRTYCAIIVRKWVPAPPCAFMI